MTALAGQPPPVQRAARAGQLNFKKSNTKSIGGGALGGALLKTPMDGARLDIAARDFWGQNRQHAFFDVRVFNPFVRSYSCLPLPRCMLLHRFMNKRNDKLMMKEFVRWRELTFPLWFLQPLDLLLQSLESLPLCWLRSEISSNL